MATNVVIDERVNEGLTATWNDHKVDNPLSRVDKISNQGWQKKPAVSRGHKYSTNEEFIRPNASSWGGNA